MDITSVQLGCQPSQQHTALSAGCQVDLFKSLIGVTLAGGSLDRFL